MFYSGPQSNKKFRHGLGPREELDAACISEIEEVDIQQHSDRALSSVDNIAEKLTDSQIENVPNSPTKNAHIPISELTTAVSPPPDGGFVAWWQVFMAHIVIFNTWGYINSFGLFQTYYESTLQRTASDISWIGSIQVFLLFFIGTASGRAADAGYFRTFFAAGLLIQLIGTFMTSLCSTYWQLFLAQGLCTGIGNGLLFCPSLSVLSTYFQRRRAQAIGIAACGTATGGVVFPIVAQQLLPKVGFEWTVRVMGFIMFGTMMLPLAFSRSRLPSRRTGPLVEWSAFRELPYALYSIGVTLCFWGLYFAYYYVCLTLTPSKIGSGFVTNNSQIGTYGVSRLDITESDSITLLLILNACGVPGLLPNLIADRWLGPVNTMIPFALISASLLYVWIRISTPSGLTVFASFYGVFAAGMLSLFPAALASLSDDPSKIGVRLGMVMSCLSFACLTGPPIGGALITAADGGFVPAQVFFGTVVALGVIFLVAVRFMLAGWRIRAKV
jgi:MFS family permease